MKIELCIDLSQICFMNEIASDDELESENVDAATTAEALLRANISQKVNIKIE